MISNKKYYFSYNIIIIFFIFSFNQLTANNSINSSHEKLQEELDTPVNKKISILAKNQSNILRIMLIIVACESFWLVSNDTDKQKLLDSLHLKPLINNILQQFSRTLLVTFCHELGHALMARYLSNSPINIHIGKNSTDTAESIIRFGGISIDGINPCIGHSSYKSPCKIQDQELLKKIASDIDEHCLKNNIDLTDSSDSVEKLKKILQEIYTGPMATKENPTYAYIDQTKTALIIIAGGIAGLFANYCQKIIRAYLKSLNQPDHTQSPFITALAIDELDIQQLFNLLFPVGTCGKGEGDAIKLYKNFFNVSPSLLNSIGKTAPFADLAAELSIELIQSKETLTPEHTFAIIFLTILNRQLRGFLRFSLN